MNRARHWAVAGIGLALALVACRSQTREPRQQERAEAAPGVAKASQPGPAEAGPVGAAAQQPTAVATPPSDPDADNDGVIGAADSCPTLAEDCDGFHDDDGCPDRDNDGDWFPDLCDSCPDVAEVFNTIRDADGCADVLVGGPIGEEVTSTASTSFVLFENGSREPVDARHVDEVAREIKRLPRAFSWTVRGGAGVDEPEPEALARARAEIVLEGLVKRGIARERLSLEVASPSPEQTRDYGNVSLHLMESQPMVSFTVAKVGRLAVNRSHETLAGREIDGFAPEEMTCPGGRRVERQAEPADPPVRAEPCVARPAETRAPRPRELGDGLLEVRPSATAVEACRQILESRYGELTSDVDCVVAWGVMRPDSGPVREAALMRVSLGDVYDPAWLALRTAEGFRYLYSLGNVEGTGVTYGNFDMESFEVRDLFAGGEPELILEWGTIELGGETLGSEDWSVQDEVRMVTVCAWGDGPVCRTLVRRVERRLWRSRDGGRPSLDRQQSAVTVDLRPDGEVVVSAGTDPPGRLQPLVGTYRWPDLPAPPSPLFDAE